MTPIGIGEVERTDMALIDKWEKQRKLLSVEII